MLPLFELISFLVFSTPIFFVNVASDERLIENAQYIDAAVSAISTASTGSADVLLSLNMLGPTAAFFMKAIVPVGGVLYAELNPKPDSDQYKQLMNLKIRTDEIWKLNKRAIETSTKVIGAKIMTNQYFVKVTHPLAVMKDLTDEYVDPSVFKTKEFLIGYKNSCKFSEKAPEEILKYLIGRLVTYCSDTVSPNDAKTLAAQRAYLVQALIRLQVGGAKKPDIDQYLKEFLHIFERLENKDVLDLSSLDVFNRRFSTYSAAFSAFFDEIRIRGSIKAENQDDSIELENCFLRELINGSNFHFAYTEAYALQLKDQLLDLGYIAGICANLSYDGYAPSVDKYINKIADNIAVISSHASNWLSVSLESAWPETHHEILEEQLVRVISDPGKVTADNLRIVIELTLPQLVETGSPNFVYQALIANSAGIEHYVESLVKYCSFKANVFGFDIVISRIPLNFTNELDKEKVNSRMLRMTDYAANLNNTIQLEMAQLYNGKNITVIMKALKQKIGTQVVSEDNFHCLSVFRAFGNWPWSPCPTIEHSQASYVYGHLRGTSNLPYKNIGSITQDFHRGCRWWWLSVQ